MMRISSIKAGIGAFAIAMLSAGCASAPTQEQIANADYGTPMSPSECRALAEQAIADQLLDPESAQFRREQPCSTGWWSSAPILGLKAAFGYLEKGEVNGKNTFGGYVGFRQFMVLMKDGVVVRSCIADENGICTPSGD